MAPEDDDGEVGITLAQVIENHGDTLCGSPECKIDAALRFVAVVRKEKDWNDVLALHVQMSMVGEGAVATAEENQALRRRFSLLLFDLVERLGGIAFVPPYAEIAARPGRISIDCDKRGGHVLRIMPPEKKTKAH